jgi:serine/threonine protein kinase
MGLRDREGLSMPSSDRGIPGVGEILAGYRIEQELGRGGMSVVYRALDPRLNRLVALKVLAPQLAHDAGFRQRFLRESQVAATIEHPNVVPVYEAGESEGVLFIAMRMVRGYDLRALLDREGALAPERAADIVSQTAAGLDAAHEQGLVHRDVKPGNILLAPSSSGEPEHVYLSDFGLTKRSRSDSALTQSGQFVGTVDYVAPEQIEGKVVDHRADIYSLGCVTFECLTGTAPFARGEEMATLYAHVNQEPPSVLEHRPELPDEVDGVLRRAMAKRPEDRFDSGRDLAAYLRFALDLGPRPAPMVPMARPSAPGPATPPAPPVPAPPRHGRRTFVAVVGAALLVAGVAVGLSVTGSGQPGPGTSSLPTGGASATETSSPSGTPDEALPSGCDALVPAGGLGALAQTVAGAAPGQTVCVSGTLSGRGIVSAAGTGSEPVTLRAVPGSGATVAGFLTVSRDARNLVLRDLTFDGSEAGAGPLLRVFGSNVRVEHGIFTRSRSALCLYVGDPANGTASQVVVEGNLFDGCGASADPNGGPALAVGSGRGVRILNNLFVGTHDAGVMLYPDARGTVIVHNSFDRGGQGVRIGGDQGFRSTGTSVRQNVIADSAVANVVSAFEAEPGASNRIEDNCLWNGVGDNFGSTVGLIVTRNAIVRPPTDQFRDPAASDYRLRPGSICDGAGVLFDGGTVAGERVDVPPALGSLG